MDWHTIEQRCESTPFVFCKTPSGNVRLWRSKRPGTYGYQVYGFIVDTNNSQDPSVTSQKGRMFYKTNGYGFCKESSALEHLFRFIGFKPQGMHLGCESIPYQYSIGGNYYDIPSENWEKID